ncbi:putative uncharacterized protein DDB_G0282129 [Bolinopsis microptera]|uniref:putative uncharacterized protein DDB_G0282129 n=1 Tax=Bolinopsis microptera TaxID=2820187 RepID=UPI003079F1B0
MVAKRALLSGTPQEALVLKKKTRPAGGYMTKQKPPRNQMGPTLVEEQLTTEIWQLRLILTKVKDQNRGVLTQMHLKNDPGTTEVDPLRTIPKRGQLLPDVAGSRSDDDYDSRNRDHRTTNYHDNRNYRGRGGGYRGRGYYNNYKPYNNYNPRYRGRGRFNNYRGNFYNNNYNNNNNNNRYAESKYDRDVKEYRDRRKRHSSSRSRSRDRPSSSRDRRSKSRERNRRSRSRDSDHREHKREVKMDEGQQDRGPENSSSAAPHSSEDPIPTHSEFESQQPEVTIDIESLG